MNCVALKLMAFGSDTCILMGLSHSRSIRKIEVFLRTFLQHFEKSYKKISHEKTKAYLNSVNICDFSL